MYGLQAMGLDGESEPYTRVEQMAKSYVDAIQTVQPQGPYLLGGHCFGAVVAFEMAQQLQRQGQEVALLAILDAPAPIAVQAAVMHDLDEAVWLTKIASSIEQASGKSLGIRHETLAPLTSEGRLQCLKERLQDVGFLPPGAGVKHVRGLVEVSKANVRAQLRYVPKDIRPTRITLFRARERHPEYDYGAGCSDSLEVASLGWDQYAAGPVTVEVVPGNHLTMLGEAHAGALAERLGERLRSPSGKNNLSTILFHKEVNKSA